MRKKEQKIWIKMGVLGGLILLSVFGSASTSEKQSKPNIIYILADDLGYGELGCYGQEHIETPNIDALAKNGMLFTQHYSGSPVCAPSRCVLLTGKHAGHAQIRGNDGWASRGDVTNYRAMLADSTLEGQRPLVKGTKTIGRLLQSVGYKTGAVGKWGLGAPNTIGIPNKQGFDFFCGYNCQRQAHTYYPVHLYLNEKRIYLDNDTVGLDAGLDKGADPLNIESYAKFNLKEYAPDVMFREMMKFVDQNKDNPFFLYWATPIPHAAIQAPKKWVDYYVEKFGDEKPYLGDNGYYPQRYPHAGYAAMISYMDAQIGKLIRKLKDDGTYNNTLIIFTSDNGPTFNGGTDSPWFNSAGQFNEERGWGKCSVHEGGIRVPLIACWTGKIMPGTQSHHVSAFYDVLPTLCELAEAQIPNDIDGVSFLPELVGKEQVKHNYLYWEYPEMSGQQAVRFDNWKAIRKNIKKGNMQLQLYNLETDIREENNVANRYPEIVNKAERIMKEAHTPAKIERFKIKQLGD